VSLRDHQRLGKPMARTGNQLAPAVPGTTYRCAPGGANDYVFIFAQQQMWHPLLRAIGREDLIGDARTRRPTPAGEKGEVRRPGGSVDHGARQARRHEDSRRRRGAVWACLGHREG